MMTDRKASVSNAASPRLRLIKYLHLILSVLLFFGFWLRTTRAGLARPGGFPRPKREKRRSTSLSFSSPQ